MNKNCTQCGRSFEITPDDLAFYEKVSPTFNGKRELIPPPTLCPDCRMQHRLLFRNERSLYRRHCAKCDKMMIGMYAPSHPSPVYCHDCWWSDAFDPLTYGRAIDFSRPFFDQLAELLAVVPLPHLVIGGCENSDYTNYSWQNRNSYLLSSSDYNEDCYYSTYLSRSKNCIDCMFVNDSELLYECVDAGRCYRSSFLQNCDNCMQCALCYDCHSCTDCIGCVGLRNKRYCVLNEEIGKEAYERLEKSMEKYRAAFEELRRRHPRKFAELKQCERSTGDHLRSCSNAVHCFDLVEAQDCRYCSLGLKPKDCMDGTGVPGSDMCYQVAACPEDYGLLCSVVIWPKSTFLSYCLFSRASDHCFGCVSLHKNAYCIFNKQYSKEEYETLVPKLIAHMRSTNEWGEFLPPALSPFSYNETVAQEHFPLTKEKAGARGFRWLESDVPQEQYLGPQAAVPQDIRNVPDSITKQILTCEVSGALFKVIPQELRFYREMGIPIPRKCPDQRHKERMALRNPRKLWNRECAKCKKVIATSYAPERPEIVYCERCYLETVY